jgi:hypothetical protein
LSCPEKNEAGKPRRKGEAVMKLRTSIAAAGAAALIDGAALATGGTGQFKEATGTLRATAINNVKTAVTITYHT